MMTPHKTRFLVAAALTGTVLAASALGLSACGKLGPLESAPPMYNDKAKARWDQNHSGDSISSYSPKNPAASSATAARSRSAVTTSAACPALPRPSS